MLKSKNQNRLSILRELNHKEPIWWFLIEFVAYTYPKDFLLESYYQFHSFFFIYLFNLINYIVPFRENVYFTPSSFFSWRTNSLSLVKYLYHILIIILSTSFIFSSFSQWGEKKFVWIDYILSLSFIFFLFN